MNLNLLILVSTTIFTLGAIGLVLRRNLIVSLMCIELMLNAINLLLVSFSHYNNNLDGQILVIFVMVLAACEVAVGLALVISIFKHFKSLDTKEINNLRG